MKSLKAFLIIISPEFKQDASGHRSSSPVKLRSAIQTEIPMINAQTVSLCLMFQSS